MIIGPPAAGKATVGKVIAQRTGMKLWHNHKSIEAILPVFDFGTPAFERLVTQFRLATFREAVRSEPAGLIFTNVIAFDEPEDLAWLTTLADLFGKHDVPKFLVELEAPLDVRVARNVLPDRRSEKPSKCDPEAAERILRADEKHRLNSMPGEIKWPDYLRLDNGELTAEEAAERVIEAFGW